MNISTYYSTYSKSMPDTTIIAGSHSSSSSARKTSGNMKNFTGSKKKFKKQLCYNPREIRSALMRASRAQSAGLVLCQAKSKLSALLRCKGTGQYDETELTNAIIHARRMVQCARMKTRNLKEEEQMTKSSAKEAKNDAQKHKSEVKLRMKQKERSLEQKTELKKQQKKGKQISRKQTLIQRRRMHRSMEQAKMEEADLEYKKNQGNTTRDSSSTAGYESFYFPLEGAELVLSDEGLELTEAQLEQQMEMMLEAEAGFSGGGIAVFSGMPAPIAATAAVEGEVMGTGEV